MSYDNFKEKVWAAGIQMDLDRLHVFVADTNREYEGVIKDLGDTVRIKNVGKPTIETHDMHEDGRYVTLSDPERVPDSTVSVVVDHYATFNYEVPNIDQAQGAKGVMEALNRETSEGLADVHDLFVSNLVKGTSGVQMYKGGQAQTLSVDNIFGIFDAAQQVLFENDVTPSTKVTITVPPFVHTILRQGFIKTDTDNSQMLKNGEVARYGNMIIKMSNNVARDTDGNYLIHVKTDRAIAFVNQFTKIVPYSPEKSFGDAVKGLDLYGGKIVRPKELIVLKAAAPSA